MDKPSGEKASSQPAQWKGKRKKAKGRIKDKAGPPDEGAGQRRLDDFGKNFRKLNLLVMSTAGHGFEMPRADRAAYVFFCSQFQKSHERMSGRAIFVGESFFRCAGE